MKASFLSLNCENEIYVRSDTQREKRKELKFGEWGIEREKYKGD